MRPVNVVIVASLVWLWSPLSAAGDVAAAPPDRNSKTTAAATPSDCRWVREKNTPGSWDHASQAAQCMFSERIIDVAFDPVTSFDALRKTMEAREKDAGGLDTLSAVAFSSGGRTLDGLILRSPQFVTKGVFVDHKSGAFECSAASDLEAGCDATLSWLLASSPAAAAFLSKRPKSSPIVCPAGVCGQQTVCELDGFLRPSMRCLIDGMFVPIVFLDDVATAKALGDAARDVAAHSMMPVLPDQKATVVDTKIDGGTLFELKSLMGDEDWFFIDGRGAFACSDNPLKPGACARLERWLSGADGAPVVDALKASRLVATAPLPTGCKRPIEASTTIRVGCASSSVAVTSGSSASSPLETPQEAKCSYGGRDVDCWCVTHADTQECGFWQQSPKVGWTHVGCHSEKGDKTACNWWARTMSSR